MYKYIFGISNSNMFKSIKNKFALGTFKWLSPTELIWEIYHLNKKNIDAIQVCQNHILSL